MALQKWKPDNNPHQARRVGKTLEELGELTAVLARISIQGIDAIDPGTQKANRLRFAEEMADVLAQINCNLRFFELPIEYMIHRTQEKEKQMQEWENHFTDEKE